MAEEKKSQETPERASGSTPQPPSPPPSASPSPGPSAGATGPGPARGRGPGRGPGGGRAPGRSFGGGGARPAGRDGFGRPRDRDRGGRGPRDDQGESPLEERVVKINRCATVVKGGRRFSFSALVVVGDRQGAVGVGFGKANEVPPSVEKAVKDAKKNFVKIRLKGHTIPHKTWGRYRTSKVVLVPAVEGTGIIAGASVRAVVECVGVQNLLTKVYGSTNPLNVVKATLDALAQLRSPEEVARTRGVEVAL